MEIAPVPSDEEAAAISAALELLWPRPVLIADEPRRSPVWRFSGRWWRRDRYAPAERPWS